ncbi:cyanophycinase [Gloeobacter kilaueensis]|uniref:Cyanophycinase n=1 Tax=Gloeobacter kilaueensis (strain ATCC BAA-2537 / CCAP 1431/1 / ULC 316 / JS1) TaxID=1183438 RepID=U5QEK2_GLOK1|nr:cyanophycinase [Gloeobacter kilaueensis]AGY57372.1 cyanophycinase [Gloeobacter kilaueensis JS1]
MQPLPTLDQQPRIYPQGSPLVVIGGAEDKEREKSILKTFFTIAGGPQARILIIPSASSMPEILAEVYRLVFVQMGAAKVDVLNITSRFEADLVETVERVRASSGVFMTGGDQVRLCNLIAHSALARAMQQGSILGQLVLAGTSAGASALGACMIARGYSGEAPKRNIVELSEGLGILKNVIVDQHFHNRNRLPRLMTAVAARPDCLGIGIDENTACILHAEGTLEVIGEGTVTIVDGSELIYNTINEIQAYQPLSVGSFRLSVMAQGLRYNLRERKTL